MSSASLPHAHVTRYAAPLREGGSLPALVEIDGRETVVAKWRGAGQGAAALVAEVIAGELARSLGLPMPQLSTLELDATIAKTERDEEIRDLLNASEGLNLGMQYLDGALAYDPAAGMPLDHGLAARIVVFDTYVMNVDRTPRNTNLLWWRDGLWLIDHGAALYWHHGWDGAVERPTRPFPLVRDHVLLPSAGDIEAEGAALMGDVTDEVITAAVDAVPDAWLPDDTATRRAAYVSFLTQRRDGAAALVKEAADARASV
ncbi:MAG: HipA family kinase [Myxococcota bacterium]